MEIAARKLRLPPPGCGLVRFGSLGVFSKLCVHCEQMPVTPQVERHFTSGEAVRDIVIGMSDGLTVPFALAAGLSGAVGSTQVVITAGLAEIAAGSIAMGLGGFLAARSDADHYAAERVRNNEKSRRFRMRKNGRSIAS